MTRAMFLADFERLPPVARASIGDGLAAAIDAVAGRAAPSHGFLRYGWYAAALAAYGGRARTLVVEEDGVATLAMPLVGIGPAWARLATVPGCYWPFRSVPLALEAGEATPRAALATLARAVNGVRIGPVYDDDPAAMALVAAARAAGWTAIDRFVADGWLLDMAGLRGSGRESGGVSGRAAGEWPRGSTLRKNRYHEKQLARRGTPDWLLLGGADCAAAFDRFAAVEAASWIATRTDGADAKFTRTGHGAFWRAAAADPVIAGMMRAALLTIDGRPAAFAFDLEAGDLRYAIANSYDPAIAKHSPGKLLAYRNLAAALARGVARVDWGAGDGGYKRIIGATPGPALRDWLLLRPGLPALAGRLGRGWWRRSGNPRWTDTADTA